MFYLDSRVCLCVCACAQQAHRQRVLAYLTAGQRHQVWRVKPLIHGGSLTGVDDEQQLIVPVHTHIIVTQRTSKNCTVFPFFAILNALKAV